MLALLRTFSWQELKRHPWRNAAAVLAVMLGVALAFSVHLINQSALSEFAGAARAASGQADLEVRGIAGRLDEALFARIAADPRVALASPVLELNTFVRTPGGERKPLRVLGIDALVAPAVTPELLPRPAPGSDRFALFAPARLFLNAAAAAALGLDTAPQAQGGSAAATLQLQDGLRWVTAQVAGRVAAGGTPLAVMDIGAAQDLFGRGGALSRIDLRLATGVPPQAVRDSLAALPGVVVSQPSDAALRVGSLSRAYRVNLTVLALVALFTGAFLVYSVLSLSVARRAQQFALLGVLGLTAPQRRWLVMTESTLVGVIGSALGIALGAALAALALRLLGGDLGGGYFPGVAPHFQWNGLAAAGYGLLGVVAAAAGGWLPSRAAEQLPLAQTLKGLGGAGQGSRARRIASLGLLATGVALAFLPPIAGLPLGAYVSVALLLVGGITALPMGVALVYDRLAPLIARRPLPLLAVERARRVRETAAVAVSGVVAALSLAVALTVMVASFRDSVARWLDVVLPADLYVRTAASSGNADSAFLPPGFVDQAARLPGVREATGQRLRALLLDPARPPVTLLARPLGEPSRSMPLVGDALTAPAGRIPVYVSEAMVDLYGARPGQALPQLSAAFEGRPAFFVAGIWRDYVRQTGAVLMDLRDYRRLTGDERINDLQLWLTPGADARATQARLRALAQREGGDAAALDFASAQEIRALSLRIFDRSFVVTYWLQGVAIAIGLFGVAASFSAQVLARRKEFGLLAHLGLTRREILAVVAGEGAAWTLIGAAAGLALGLAVAVVLVKVVNPQSFHWTMDLMLPGLRLAAVCAAVVVAGTLTAWLAGRAAAGRDAVLAVKEDW
ncbi:MULTISPECIES: FtsX-like permease family protein [Ramlibacter]|uniref:ABC transporter permease n=1 Tax=Ramlibacter aquaticus TaxID=2780094 RepID=A0ABR9SEF7_9BURK|nr:MULTISPECIES: FtsX-like permease family protein [Ramlibacter]MBE7940740.1 ABC transporter permease [Ramlibacter aquaticus]